MIRSNYIIVWHDRHTDDRYFIALNATYDEAEAKEREVAERAGWLDNTEASEYGYGDYGYNEDYYIELRSLDDDQVTDFMKKD